jgi:hypothetical protein
MRGPVMQHTAPSGQTCRWKAWPRASRGQLSRMSHTKTCHSFRRASGAFPSVAHPSLAQSPGSLGSDARDSLLIVLSSL